MASDYLLEIDGIKGESQDKRHDSALEVESFSWGESNLGTAAAGGGAGAGKVAFQDFHFTTKISTASPLLFLSCATGEHIKKATLFVRKSGGEQQDYYTVILSDCLVSSYQQGGPSTDPSSRDVVTTVPTDQFSLNFAKIELDYKVQKADGSLGESVKAGYDLKLNKKI